MRLAEARDLAEDLAREMTPYCHTVTVAGSIRRGRPEVKDLEIVAVPRWAEVPDRYDLLGETTVRRNELFRWAAGSAVWWVKTGTRERKPWAIKEDGKYWRGLVGPFEDDVVLDLFLAAPENAGIITVIRTGCAEFSQALVTHAKRIGMPCAGGYLTSRGKPVPTPTEEDVFRMLGLAWVEPEARTGAEALCHAR